MNKLKLKGLKKFISFEVPIDQCKDLYSYIAEDLQKTDDMRVLDFDGHHIFNNYAFVKCNFFTPSEGLFED